MAPTWSGWLAGIGIGCGLEWELCTGRGGGTEEGRLEGLSCNVGDACSMLFHTCRSWYFPRLLLRVGSLTHMNIASLMVFEWLYFLVYYVEVFQVQWMSCGCAVMEYWGRGLEMFFNPFSQCPAWFSYVCLRAVDIWTFIMVDNATFLCLWILILGVD